MKMKTLFSFALFLMAGFSTVAQDLSAYHMIASYPFTADGKEAGGNYDPALIMNAEFKNGGIYSNGIYNGSDPAGSLIRTANIAGLSMEKHAVTLEFNADGVDVPLLCFGDYWRWLVISIKADSGLELFASKTDGSARIISPPGKINPGKWYKMAVLYDSASGEIAFYLDGALISKDTLTAPYRHSRDFTFANEDGGAGFVFKGYWRNLNIYNEGKSTGLSAVESEEPNIRFDPLSRSLFFDRTLDDGFVELYDLNGRISAAFAVQNERRAYLPEHIRSGIYIVRLQNKAHSYTAKILVHY